MHHDKDSEQVKWYTGYFIPYQCAEINSGDTDDTRKQYGIHQRKQHHGPGKDNPEK